MRLLGDGVPVLPFNTLAEAHLAPQRPSALTGRDVRDDARPHLPSADRRVLIDATSAGTTMVADLSRRSWAPELLAHGRRPDLLPRWVEPGEVIGGLTSAAVTELGRQLASPWSLPVTTPGSPPWAWRCASLVVLSSGTWEILMAGLNALRSRAVDGGLIVELDPVPGSRTPSS